jgi:hypothetical protein
MWIAMEPGASFEIHAGGIRRVLFAPKQNARSFRDSIRDITKFI